MNTEQILQLEADNVVDCFYSYLLKESDGDMLCDELKGLFLDAGIKDFGDIAFILDGIEEKYFADHTYFRSEVYGNEIYQIIPVGEIEVYWDEIDKACQDDFVKSGEYGYTTLPAVTIVYNIGKVKEAITDYLA